MRMGVSHPGRFRPTVAVPTHNRGSRSLRSPGTDVTVLQTLIHPVERRASQRHRVRYLRFYSPIPGTILDVSEWGMSLETVTAFEPGTHCVFRVRQSSMLFSFAGMVVWSRRRDLSKLATGNPIDLYCSGVAFSEPMRRETLEFLAGIA